MVQVKKDSISPKLRLKLIDVKFEHQLNCVLTDDV